jgi:hypothetical protein
LLLNHFCAGKIVFSAHHFWSVRRPVFCAKSSPGRLPWSSGYFPSAEEFSRALLLSEPFSSEGARLLIFRFPQSAVLWQERLGLVVLLSGGLKIEFLCMDCLGEDQVLFSSY